MMQYLNFLGFISEGTLLTLIAFCLFLTAFVVARFYKSEEGVFPRLTHQMSRLGEWFTEGLDLTQHFLFGSITKAVDDFLANEEEFQKSAKGALRWWNVLVFASLAISYQATSEISMWLGFQGWTPYMMPLIIDAIIIACILTIQAYARTGDRNQLASSGVGVYTVLSIIMNIAHLAWNTGISPLIFLTGMAAPAGIWLCSEQIFKLTLKMAFREGAQMTDHQLKEQTEDRQRELEEVQKQIEEALQLRAKESELNAKVLELQGDVEHLETLITRLDGEFIDKVPNAQGRLDQVSLLVENGANASEVAETLGVSDKTARSYVRSVNGSTGA